MGWTHHGPRGRYPGVGQNQKPCRVLPSMYITRLSFQKLFGKNLRPRANRSAFVCLLVILPPLRVPLVNQPGTIQRKESCRKNFFVVIFQKPAPCKTSLSSHNKSEVTICLSDQLFVQAVYSGKICGHQETTYF